jgi:hypothetical protein
MTKAGMVKLDDVCRRFKWTFEQSQLARRIGRPDARQNISMPIGGENRERWLIPSEQLEEWVARLRQLAPEFPSSKGTVTVMLPAGGSYILERELLDVLGWTDAKLTIAQSLRLPKRHLLPRSFAPPEPAYLRHEAQQWLDAFGGVGAPLVVCAQPAVA